MLDSSLLQEIICKTVMPYSIISMVSTNMYYDIYYWFTFALNMINLFIHTVV